MGYSLAGFDVVGVDIEAQPRYPFEFHQADAIEFISKHGCQFAAIHASPPCQKYTKAGKQWRREGKEYPDLVHETRKVLRASGRHYVIENVPGAPLLNPIMLNGAMFSLLVHRNRLFETSFEIPFFLLPVPMKPVKMGRPVNQGDVIQPVGHFSNTKYAAQQMGIDWMTQNELAQAIPPAYTKFIGGFLLQSLHLTTA